MAQCPIEIVFKRSDGRELHIDDAPWGLVDAKGLDEPNLQVFSQPMAVGDGDIITGKRVGAREIEIEAKARTAAINDIARRSALAFFRPQMTYDVYVSRYGNRRYSAKCELDSVSVPVQNIYKPVSLSVTLLSPEGYWLSEDSFGKNIAGKVDRSGWPFVSYAPYGRIYGVFSFAKQVYIDNDGDAEAYCKAVLRAQGEVHNPKLMCNNGFVRLLHTMQNGDELVIDGREKSVRLNGENASIMLDKASNFHALTLALGTSEVAYSADIGDNLLDVYVYYNKRYMGV